jgi:hypothetical protein
VLADEAALELVADEVALFWATATEVRTCAIAACEPFTIAEADAPHHLLLDGGHVLFASGRDMFWIARDGSGMLQSWRDDSDDAVVAFIRRGNEIVWTATEPGLTRCNYDPAAGTCDGTSSVMGPGLADVENALVTDLTDNLWTTRNGNDVIQVDYPGRAIAKQFMLDRARALATSSTHVFATSAGSGEVVGWELTAADDTLPLTIVDGQAPLGLVHDAEHLYVADGNGTIVRVDLLQPDGGVEEVAAELGGLRAIAVTDDRMFAIVGDQIASLPKR